MSFAAPELYWSVPEKVAILTKSDESTLEISIGTIFQYSQRKEPCKVTSFTFKASDPRGPIGITYIPWRGTHWATLLWTLKGDSRHIIAFPVGMPHYGQQIDWNTFEIVTDKNKLLELKASENLSI